MSTLSDDASNDPLARLLIIADVARRLRGLDATVEQIVGDAASEPSTPTAPVADDSRAPSEPEEGEPVSPR